MLPWMETVLHSALLGASNWGGVAIGTMQRCKMWAAYYGHNRWRHEGHGMAWQLLTARAGTGTLSAGKFLVYMHSACAAAR